MSDPPAENPASPAGRKMTDAGGAAEIDGATETSAGGAVPTSVLYVDDNLPNTLLLTGIMQRRPCVRLICASRGAEALALVKEHDVRLVLLDLHLPDCDGDEVLRAIRTDPATAGIPVVIVSADAMPKQIERLLRAGANRYLTKPIRVREVLEVVDCWVHADRTPPVTSP